MTGIQSQDASTEKVRAGGLTLKATMPTIMPAAKKQKAMRSQMTPQTAPGPRKFFLSHNDVAREELTLRGTASAYLGEGRGVRSVYLP